MFDEHDSSAVEGQSNPSSQSQIEPLKVASFFAGVGGFDHAFELEEASVVFQCEKDKYCRSVLARHWPKTKLATDIREVTADDVPESEVWTAGFPCQDVSLARGNHGRTGLKGNHTSLFFALAELIRFKKPEIVLLENVVGLLNSHKGQDFAVILRELTSQGYAVSWRVLNARYFGAPQSRPRVFLCAWKADPEGALKTLFEAQPAAKPGTERLAFITEEKHPTGARVSKISYCVSATSGRHTGLDWARSYVSYKDRVRRPTPTESERLQGFPADWTLPQDDYPVPGRGLDSERYRAAGNAVAVPVVRWIARRLSHAHSAKSEHEGVEKLSTISLESVPDLKASANWLNFSEIENELEEGEFAHRWKSGGCAFGDEILEAKVSPAPSTPIEKSFVDALDPKIPDSKYFLTANAAVGILRRADAQRRNLFPPMRKALEILTNKSNLPRSES